LLRFGSIRISLVSWFVTMNVCLLLVAGLGAAAAFKSQRVLVFFAGGTGLYGTPSHSLTGRESRIWATLDLVKNSPFIGYSLGGVATALGESEGTNITSSEGAKAHEGMSVFAEVLAASGVIGFIPFIVYMCTLFVAPLRLSRGCPEPYRTVLIGLVWALAIEIIMLQLNQNILRPYLWFHIAMLSAAYAVVREHLLRNKPSTRA